MPSLRAASLTLSALVALAAPAVPARAATAAATATPAWAGMAHTSFRHQTDIALGVGTGLAQDRQGFIWMSTQTGLVRWDGFRLRRYIADSSRPGSLPDSYLQCVRVDGSGRIWAGTSSGGLVRYDPAHDNFITIGAGPQGLSHGRVSSLEDDGAGGIWIGTGGGLERIDAAGRLYRAGSGPAQVGASQLPPGGVEVLLREPGGALWIGTRQGLFRRTADHAPLRAITLTGGATEPGINALYQDARGRIWIGTRAHGAFVIPTAGAPARPVSANGLPILQGERVLSVIETRPDVIWFGTEGGGILELDLARQRTRRLRHHPDAPDSLFDDDAVAMMRERGGQIFVSTAEALSVYDPRPQRFITVRSTTPGGIGKLSAMSVLARPDGRVWLALSGGAISIVDPQRGQVGQIEPQADVRHGGLPKARILSMVDGPDGTVYVGTQQGVFHSRADGSDVRRVSVPGRPEDGAAYALAYRDGVLWVGGLDGIWTLALGSDSNSGALLGHQESRLGDSRVSAILPLADGSAWVGTRAGLARVVPRTGQVELLPTDVSDPSRLQPGYVSSLMLDRQGRLWVSCFSSGVAVLEATDPDGRRRFRRIGKADGLPDNGVNVVVAALDGTLWLSTDNGLASIDPITYAIRAYGVGDGVHLSTYWTGAAARSPNGDILFGGLSGVTVVKAAAPPPRTDRARMAVTRVVLGDHDIPSTAFNDSAARAVLTLSPAERARGFSLEYTALDYAPPGEDRYAYRLAGFDREWIDTDGPLRRVSYNNLPPGDYTLQLRATMQGSGAVVHQDVPVRVLPAWHQQRWVQVLGGLALAGLFAMLMQLRTRLLRRRQRELEAMVAERTAELRAIQSRLETMAYADPLTGLPNRRMFNDDMRRMAAQALRGGAPFSLLLIDLDHFKAINDTLGHDAGDALLVEAARRLNAAVRAGDRVLRLGGDEFAVLLEPGSAPADIGGICDRIIASMAQPVRHGTAEMRISASVGGAAFDARVHDVDSLYKAADLALYRAKEAGRNTWRFGADASVTEPVPA